ncbi:hypothetical protein BaRGS_00023592 [Batillaria attramentaria]|uniref:Uncharacterized protein n=1 Tax=Batillaria attramentaria TaxID=370345 RepID=A0ABD0KE34_9CAEN
METDGRQSDKTFTRNGSISSPIWAGNLIERLHCYASLSSQRAAEEAVAGSRSQLLIREADRASNRETQTLEPIVRNVRCHSLVPSRRQQTLVVGEEN